MQLERAKEIKKSQIIQAALDLFVERGYNGTKTSQISKRAGISEGLLFHYFPTKEILLEELINIGLDGMRMPMQIQLLIAEVGWKICCEVKVEQLSRVKTCILPVSGLWRQADFQWQ